MTQATRRPTCPSCGGTSLMRSGLVSFAWSRGEWRVRPETAEMLDTSNLNCGNCGIVILCPDINEPWKGLTAETQDFTPE